MIHIFYPLLLFEVSSNFNPDDDDDVELDEKQKLIKDQGRYGFSPLRKCRIAEREDEWFGFPIGGFSKDFDDLLDNVELKSM